MNNKQISFLFITWLLIASPSYVYSYGGVPTFQPNPHPDINLHTQNLKEIAKNKMIQESDNEFTKQLFDEFDIDVYDASMPREKRVQLRSSSGGENEDVGVAVMGLIGAVNAAVSIAQKIVSFFGKQYSERLVGSFTNNGYSKFSGSAKIMHGQGLPYKNIPRFLELLGRSRGVPNQYKEEMLSIGRWAQYTSRNDLTKQTVEFSAGSGGNCKVLQFYIQNNRAEQKLDLFILTVENSFKLAPDVFVILEETSQFWGMKSSANIRFEKRPASLKPDQIKFVSDYFSLIALEELADFLNVENGKPNMKPKAGGSNMDTMWDNADLFTTKSKPTSKWVNNMKVDPDFFGDDRKRNSRMVWSPTARGQKETKKHHHLLPRMVWRGHKKKKKHYPEIYKIEGDYFDSMQDSRMERDNDDDDEFGEDDRNPHERAPPVCNNLYSKETCDNDARCSWCVSRTRRSGCREYGYAKRLVIRHLSQCDSVYLELTEEEKLERYINRVVVNPSRRWRDDPNNDRRFMPAFCL
jgi:hypothetical protein